MRFLYVLYILSYQRYEYFLSFSLALSSLSMSPVTLYHLSISVFILIYLFLCLSLSLLISLSPAFFFSVNISISKTYPRLFSLQQLRRNVVIVNMGYIQLSVTSNECRNACEAIKHVVIITTRVTANILLTKTTAAQNEAALSYHRLRSALAIFSM